jgi:hypothetical protein
LTAIANGMRLARTRLFVPAGLFVLGLGALLVLVTSGLERGASRTVAADRTLTGAVFGIVLPLIAFATLERVTLRERLDTATNGIARYGFSRRGLALGLLATSSFVLAGAGCVLSALAVLATRTGEPGWQRDLLTSAWIGAIAGAAYAAWFLLASTFGKRGGGRPIALALDWVFGSMSSWIAAPWPRGHIRNLLGSTPVANMSQAAALLTLLALGTIYAVLALRRLRA